MGVVSLARGKFILVLSTTLTGVLCSFDCGVLNTFPGKSTNGLTPFISGVLKRRELAKGENIPLSKSEIVQLSEFDVGVVVIQVETGAISVAIRAELELALEENDDDGGATVLVDVAVAVLELDGVVRLAV